jgi:hypothetical protein
MKRPDLTFTAGDQEIRWTYGLQLDLQRLVPDTENVIAAIMGDTYVRDYLVRRALTPLKKSVLDEAELITAEDIDLDPDQVLALLEWISGHLLHFFSRSVTNLMAQGAEFKESLPKAPTPSEPSADGSAA